jgi:hypothetical protein
VRHTTALPQGAQPLAHEAKLETHAGRARVKAPQDPDVQAHDPARTVRNYVLRFPPCPTPPPKT